MGLNPSNLKALKHLEGSSSSDGGEATTSTPRMVERHEQKILQGGGIRKNDRSRLFIPEGLKKALYHSTTLSSSRGLHPRVGGACIRGYGASHLDKRETRDEFPD